MPLISIIVPVYNAEKELNRCIDSILNQTFTDYELILIDDGSTDHSGFICDKYSENNSGIRVFHQKNMGQAAARNFGIKKSKAEWLCFIDSDDCINPYYLEYLYDAVNNNSVNMAVCNYVEQEQVPENFFDKTKLEYEIYPLNENNMISLIQNFPNSYWTVWGKIIKKHIVEQNMFFEGKIFEDNAVAPKWLYNAGTVAALPLNLYYYYVNENGTTKSEFSDKKLDLLWAYEEQIYFLKKIGYYQIMANIVSTYIDIANSFCMQLEKNERKDKKKAVRIRTKKCIKNIKRDIPTSSTTKSKINEFLHHNVYRVLNIIR